MSTKVYLSIVIPTLNEEQDLPLLLESIKGQNFKDYEVIVADAGSKDNTVKIAEKYKCRVVPGGLPGTGKNNGAKTAQGKLLFFLDADTLPPQDSKDFLDKSLNEFKQKNLQIASFLMAPKRKNRVFQFLLNLFYNWPILFVERILPHAAMGIIIEKELFNELKGFDETIRIAEDHDLARRAIKKKKKFGIIKSSKLFISSRRFKQDGWLKTYAKYLICELYMIFIGPIRTDIFNYRFNHYSQEKRK